MRKFFLLIAILVTYSSCDFFEVGRRPNIIWLTTEDNSTHHMKLYNENGAIMPVIEKLASEGIVFDNAFSNAPVCSVARSTLITGCYAPRIFTQFHRRAKHVSLPNDLMPMPYYLKEAGYYTTNNSKQDYNFILPDEVWDESSSKATYRNRQPGQPFFHVQNYTVTHESNLHFSQDAIDKTANEDLEHIKVFPYHPDTKTLPIMIPIALLVLINWKTFKIKKSILTIALSLPVLLFVAYFLKPTQKAIIESTDKYMVQQSVDNGTTLYALLFKSYSSQFYSKGRIKVITPKELERMVISSKIFSVIIQNRHKSQISPEILEKLNPQIIRRKDGLYITH